MTSVWRWSVVVVGTAVLVTAPVALRSWPAADSRVDAAALLERVRTSADRQWSGYVEAEGALQLPDAGRFDDVAGLLGERSRMRVWWEDEDHWRVDQLLVSGESDLVHDGDTTVAWDYERAEARVSRDPDIRLPRTADLVPPTLAVRLLRGVSAEDVSALAAVRVAGRSAPGLRVTPASPLSSIDHADLWADPDTGIPLRVVVHAAGESAPSFSSTFQDFSAEPPERGVVSVARVSGLDAEFDDVLDIADAANQYAPVRPPSSAAGLEKSSASQGAVGVYGTGMTQLIAIPLRDREADDLRDQLAVTRGVAASPGRTSVSVGPLGVLLTGEHGQGGWLLAGTVTPEGLARAADDVVDGFVYVGDGS